jgi:hypothetical protein
MNDYNMSNLKPYISVSAACQLVGLSRARFYQLIEQGIFPQPIYHIRTKRPYYDIALQKKLLEIRDTCIGENGDLIIFYSPRKNKSTSTPKKKKVDPVVKELTEILNSMGLETTTNRVKQGLTELYPAGIKDVDQGVVIRELFRFIKSE